MNRETITVKVPLEKIKVWKRHEIDLGMNWIILLRSRGVPVLGALWPCGVEHGSLETWQDETHMCVSWHFDPSCMGSVL